MPKLPLDREKLRLLPGVAIDAVRHPRRTASQAVSGSITVVGRLLDRRPATEPVPGMVSEPADQPEGNEPPGPVAARPAAVEDTVEDLAPAEEPTPEPESDGQTVTEPIDAPGEELDELGELDDLDEGPSDTRPEGPAPHMPPRIAGDVERDYDEDIPGITPARRDRR